MRISVNCSRKGLVALPSNRSSSSAVHRPSFGRGCTSRSYSAEVAPDRRTLRTVFRDTLRSRAISLIVLPLKKCSRRIRPIVSTVSIPPPLASNQSEQRIRPNGRGSILDADNPTQGVKIARRNTLQEPRGLKRDVLLVAMSTRHAVYRDFVLCPTVGPHGARPARLGREPQSSSVSRPTA